MALSGLMASSYGSGGGSGRNRRLRLRRGQDCGQLLPAELFRDTSKRKMAADALRVKSGELDCTFSNILNRKGSC